METLDAMQRQLAADFPQRLLRLPSGAQVAWRKAGPSVAETALVLLHGISSGAASWLGVAAAMRHLCPDVRVLAWDAPGYGDSTPLALAVPTAEDYAQVLEAALSVLGVQRCVLVGHSLGALMAAAVARRDRAGRVQQLVLISPAGGYGGVDFATQRAQVRQRRLDALRAHGVAGLAATIDQRLAAPGTPEGPRQWMRFNTARMQPGGYAQAVELLCNTDLGQSARQLPMPVQVWVGEHDIVTPPDACTRWAQRLHAQYATIAAGGHAVPVEQPAVIAQKLADLHR